MHNYFSKGSLFLCLLMVTGCQSQEGYERPRRHDLRFQEAEGPVFVYPIDKNRSSSNSEEFLLPQNSVNSPQQRPVPSGGQSTDLQPIDLQPMDLPPSYSQPRTYSQVPTHSQPSSFSKTPAPAQMSKSELPKTELPKRGAKVSLNKRDVQFLLKELGLYQGALDGKHGPGTMNAIRSFQRQHGLTVDGKAGPKTQKALVQATQDRYKKNTQP